MINKILCFFRLHPYKLIVKLKPTEPGKIVLPFEVTEVCKVCGKERDKATGTMGLPEMKGDKNV